MRCRMESIRRCLSSSLAFSCIFVAAVATAAITAAQPSLAAPRRSPQFDQADVNLDALQRRTIARVLDQVRGNKSQAAKRLGLTRSQLYERLRKYNLEPPAGSFDDQAGFMPAV